jgi:hypothetical protein
MGSVHWVFIGCAFAAALLGRGLSIYPLAYLYKVSLLRQLPEDHDDDSVAAVGPAAATGGVITRRRIPRPSAQGPKEIFHGPGAHF